MLIDFFFALRNAKVPVSIKEFLTLLEALEKASSRPPSTSSTTWRAWPW